MFLRFILFKKDYDENEMKLQKEEVENIYWFPEEKVNELCDNGTFKTSHIEAFKILSEKLSGKY